MTVRPKPEAKVDEPEGSSDSSAPGSSAQPAHAALEKRQADKIVKSGQPGAAVDQELSSASESGKPAGRVAQKVGKLLRGSLDRARAVVRAGRNEAAAGSRSKTGLSMLDAALAGAPEPSQEGDDNTTTNPRASEAQNEQIRRIQSLRDQAKGGAALVEEVTGREDAQLDPHVWAGLCYRLLGQANALAVECHDVFETTAFAERVQRDALRRTALGERVDELRERMRQAEGAAPENAPNNRPPALGSQLLSEIQSYVRKVDDRAGEALKLIAARIVSE